MSGWFFVALVLIAAGLVLFAVSWRLFRRPEDPPAPPLDPFAEPGSLFQPREEEK